MQTAEGQFQAAGLSATRDWKKRNRFRSFDELVGSEPGWPPHIDIGVSMHLVFEQLFRDEFQFKKRDDPRIVDFAGGDRAASLFFEACYGSFPEDERLDYVRTYYQEVFAAETVVPSPEIWAAIERQEAGYPLYYTTHGMNQYFEGSKDETVFIFDPLSATDVLDFWNLRLFTRDVLPVNVHWLAQSRDMIVEAIRKNHRPLPSNSHGVMIRTTVMIARSLDSQRISDALDLADAELPPWSFGIQSWYPPIWIASEDDRVVRPTATPLIALQKEVQLVPDNHAVRLPQLSPNVADMQLVRGPSWVNVVSTRFYGGSGVFAEAMPSAAVTEHDSYPLCKSIHLQMPTREGHVTFHDFPHDGNYFQLATRHEAVFGWLRARGIEAQPSDAGRVADELIASVGGVMQSVLLAHPEAIEQFDKMARSRVVHVGGDSEEFPDRTASIGQMSSMIGRIRAKPFGEHLTLQDFVDAGVLRLGIAVRCIHCTKENWYSLDDIASAVRCERCLKRFDYPQGRAPTRDTWKYRVVGPFATPHYAQGAYSVALTLRFLRYVFRGMEEFTYTTSLNFRVGGEELETDFFVWHSKHAFTRNARDPALLVGECKSFGVEVFKRHDIARLRRLGELLPGAFLVAATLKTTLSQKEIDGLRALSRWGWKRATADRWPTRVIVLTGTELFSFGSLHETWTKAGGALGQVAESCSHIFDFDRLARATQQAYLGFSEDELYGFTARPRRNKSST
ncbi:MAG: hypothetical protein KDA64_11690 [Rhodospirillaceae bacterium]|nr:hypothetical protein [Rhodospirillaceae bacterium]